MGRKPSEFENHPKQLTTIEYRGVCKYVVDGDTYDILVDLGFNQYHYVTVRLFEVDTPEIFRPKTEAERTLGKEAKSRVEEWMLDAPVLIETQKDATTFGRYVAKVWFWDEEWKSLGDCLIENKLTKSDVQ